MSNTYTVYYEVSKFCSIRDENRKEYQETMKRIEKYKGSAGYKESEAAAAKKRKQSDDAARTACSEAIKPALKAMVENIGKIGLVPPTPEALAILQALQMRTRLKPQDFDAAAVSMGGNHLALAALDDLADSYRQKNKDANVHYRANYLETYGAKDFSAGGAEACMKSFNNEIRKILQSSVIDAARFGAEYNRNQYGIKADMDALRQRDPFAGERDFLERTVGSDNVDAFMKAVN